LASTENGFTRTMDEINGKLLAELIVSALRIVSECYTGHMNSEYRIESCSLASDVSGSEDGGACVRVNADKHSH
uniref:Gigantea n=1 Tax=Anisakis simplex TaxID=6269 RepID=A0A0M3JN29_ANISI